MVYQLWVSPVSRLRRRGTRHEELSQLYSAGLTSRAIYEPLQSCQRSDNPGLVAVELGRRGFDVVGVIGPDGRPDAYIAREDLARNGDFSAAKSFSQAELISETTPIVELFPYLASTPRAFVIEGTQVKGIVTRADLLKPPVRVLLFGMISLLEMHLTYWAKLSYPGESWMEALSDGRLEGAKKIQAHRQVQEDGISLEDCLQLADKGTLVRKHDDLRTLFGFSSSTDASGFFSRLEQLRNALAHSQEALLPGEDWTAVSELVERMDQMLRGSDERIEHDLHLQPPI